MRIEHPCSKKTLEGVALGTGALLDDAMYAHHSGEWVMCGLRDARIQPNCELLWVLETEVSSAAKVLLGLMVKTGDYLCKGDDWYPWLLVPMSVLWDSEKHVVRTVTILQIIQATTSSPDAGAAKELIDLGFIYSIPENRDVLAPTSAGLNWLETQPRR